MKKTQCTAKRPIYLHQKFTQYSNANCGLGSRLKIAGNICIIEFPVGKGSKLVSQISHKIGSCYYSLRGITSPYFLFSLPGVILTFLRYILPDVSQHLQALTANLPPLPAHQKGATGIVLIIFQTEIPYMLFREQDPLNSIRLTSEQICISCQSMITKMQYM